jgi:uncharacterized protein (DUF952 family)
MLHLTPEEQWAQHAAKPDYVSESFAEEGFIHCTHGDALVLEVGDRYYRDDPRAYVLLEIVPALLSASVRYEDDGGRYPHVYGAIDQAAIVRVRRVERHADGTFLALGEAISQPNR